MSRTVQNKTTLRRQVRHSALSVLLLAVLPLLAAFAGCGTPKSNVAQVSSFKGYNLVVVVIDTLRADHLGAYGYERDTSPFLDSLAEEGLLFEDVLSSSSYTRQAITTFLSGRLPTRAGKTGLWARPSPDKPVLTDYLKKAGYSINFLTNQPSMAAMIVNADRAHTFNDSYLNEPELVEKALEFVELSTASSDDPYFLYIHHLGPHAPYDPPPEFFDRVFGRSERQRMHLSPWTDDRKIMMEEGVAPGHPKFDEMVRAYDADIAYTEDAVQSLIEGLRTRGLLENTLVLFTSDHGEEFLDHEHLEHSWTLYDEVLHVPLILWADDGMEPARISAPLSHADILPTLLTLFEIPYDPEEFDGSAFFTGTGEAFEFTPVSKPRIAELIFAEKTIQRMVRNGPWKLYTSTKWIPPENRYLVQSKAKNNRLRIMNGDFPIPPLWSPYEFEALFNIDKDPLELDNLIDRNPDRAADLRKLLSDYRQLVEQQGLGPKWSGSTLDEISEEDLEALEGLGYIQ